MLQRKLFHVIIVDKFESSPGTHQFHRNPDEFLAAIGDSFKESMNSHGIQRSLLGHTVFIGAPRSL
jgi:hypothetical protein